MPLSRASQEKMMDMKVLKCRVICLPSFIRHSLRCIAIVRTRKVARMSKVACNDKSMDGFARVAITRYPRVEITADRADTFAISQRDKMQKIAGMPQISLGSWSEPS